MLRHTSRWLALAGLIALVLAACSSSPGSSSVSVVTDAAGGDPSSDMLARIQDRGTLVGYAELDYPPQSIRVEDATRPAATKCQQDQLTGAEVSGYDIETNELVAADLGVEPCFARPTWAEVTGGNWGDRWDIAYGSGSINADRMTRLWMTQPYYATPNRFFVRADSPIQAAAELSGKEVGSRRAARMRRTSAGTRDPRCGAHVRSGRSGDRRSRPSGPASKPSRTGRSRRSSAPSRSAEAMIEEGGAARARPTSVHVLPVGLRRQELRL